MFRKSQIRTGLKPIRVTFLLALLFSSWVQASGDCRVPDSTSFWAKETQPDFLSTLSDFAEETSAYASCMNDKLEDKDKEIERLNDKIEDMENLTEKLDDRIEDLDDRLEDLER